MPKIFYREEWFFELSPHALYETEFESLLIQNASSIKSNSLIVPFKKLVKAGSSAAKPDLAIIQDDYRDWTVVEVEMLRHDFYGHVLPQVRTFRDGEYTAAHAEYLHGKNPYLDLNRLKAMMKGSPPKILVIANKPDESWHRELRSNGIFLMTFEIYRSHRNHHIFSIDGEIPASVAQNVTMLHFDPILPRMLVVESPAMLTIQTGTPTRILIQDQITDWERMDIADKCYLSPMGTMPIKSGSRYALVVTEDREFSIHPTA